jgi:hypothetical protein
MRSQNNERKKNFRNILDLWGDGNYLLGYYCSFAKGFFLLCLEAIDNKSDLCGHELHP